MLNCNGLYVRLGFQGSGLGQIKLYTPLSKMFSKRAPAPGGAHQRAQALPAASNSVARS